MIIDALIIARESGSGIYRRNSVLVKGKPLVEYTIDAAKQAASVRNIYLMSDDSHLLGLCRKYKGVKIIKSDARLFSNGSIKKLVSYAAGKIGRCDALTVLPAEMPLRTAKHIDDAVSFAGSLDSFDSVVSVNSVRKCRTRGVTLGKGRRISKVPAKPSRCCSGGAVYEPNNMIFIVRASRIGRLNDLMISRNSYAFETDEYSSVDVDNQYDIAAAEAMIDFDKERFSWDSRGGYNVQRFYVHDDPEMGIRRNVFDKSAYDRHFARYGFFLPHIKRTDSVLDIACGSGYGSEMLAGKAKRVYGIDGDAETIKYARRNHAPRNVKFDSSAIEDFNTKELFDKVISVETIEHLADPERFLKRASGWLRKGGEIWLTCPLSEPGAEQARNPFHISEITHGMLRSMMSKYFNNVDFFTLSGKGVFSTDTLKNKVSYIVARGSKR